MIGFNNELVKVNLLDDELVKVNLLGEIVAGKGSEYEGSYEVTPSEEEQILNTKNKFLNNDITVHKIPSNYGKITWTGYNLIVS